ncbi:MAG: T9SS type A sorting domain-containing protein [Chitinophagales bacterium]
MKIIQIIAFAILLVLKNIAFSQPIISSQRCFGTSYGDYFTDAIATNDNGFLATLFYEGTDGDATPDDPILHPAIIVKFDSVLNIEWQKEFGGTTGYNNTIKILQLPNGYLIGAFSSATDGDFEGNHGERDFALLKTDFNGNKIWAKCYGGPGDDYIKSVMITDDNSYLMTGSANIAGGDIPFIYGDGFSTDAVVMKIDSNGEILWTKVFGGSSYDGPVGDPVLVKPGVYQMHIYSASDDHDLADADTSAGELKRWVVNIDADGNIIKQNFISSVTDLSTADGSTVYDNNQTMIVGVGFADSESYPQPEPHEGFEGAVAIFDNSLNLTELHQWGGSHDDRFFRFTNDNYGNFIFIGSSKSLDGDVPGNYNDGLNNDFWMLKTDPDLNKLWSINFGGASANPYGDIGPGGFVGNLICKNNHIYLFASCVIPNLLPDQDIECGHYSTIPGFNFTDAWLVDFTLPYNEINDISQDSIKIFPNPVSEILNVKTAKFNKNVILNIYNVNSEKVYSNLFEDSSNIILNTSDFPVGFYLINIINDNKLIYSSTFIVQH